jgi:hypothetical protein
MALQDGKYVVFLQVESNQCLGVNGGSCALVKYNPQSSAATWNVRSVAGSRALLLQHVDTGLYLTFGQSPMEVKPLDPNGTEFYIVLDDVGDGFVAINNHDESLVVDANVHYSDQGVPTGEVTPWNWNGGSNQRWRFVPQ